MMPRIIRNQNIGWFYFVLVIMGFSTPVLAQRDTLTTVNFPFKNGYHQTFSGLRMRPADSAFIPVSVHFYQEISEPVINKEGTQWFQWNTYSEVGSIPQKGYYYLSRDKFGAYWWHAGPEWKYLMIPPRLIAGQRWKSKHAGQKYFYQVVKTDTMISTPFGSHRCFVLKTEVLNQYFEGKKHRSATWDFYDPNIGKVKSVTITWEGRGKREVFREQIELTDFGIGK
jgi:hypothetical protein